MSEVQRDYDYYSKLKSKLNEYNEAYYEQDAPIITDYEYDQLLLELEEIEAEHPEWVATDSPSQHIGGSASQTFSKVDHEVKMESLQDVFSLADLENFVRKTNRDLGYSAEWIVEEKIDGLSISLEYRDGVFWQGSTRGDGSVGEDVTQNLLTVGVIPHLLLEDKPSRLVVRGEVYMPKASFIALNKQQAEHGLKLFANPRNAAAGSLRQLDPEITRSRDLSLFCFNVQLIEGVEFSTHYESLEFLRRNGLPLIEAEKPSTDIDELMAEIVAISERRTSLEYGIDGAVVKLNSLADRARLGSTSKYPRWAAAYKYPPEQAETIIEDIEVQVGRTGKLTPLAHLTPVFVDGSTVAKATLHNEDFVKEKDIRIGDTVKIQKAGDIIPEITEVILDKRSDDSVAYVMPEECPVCGSTAVRYQGEAATYCTNQSCPAQVARAIEHFASRSCMEIAGLGERNVEMLLEKGFIEDIADIYLLHEHREDLVELPGYGKKSIDKLLDAIELSKNNSLERLINGLGISFIGTNGSRLLAENVKNLDELMAKSVDDLQAIPGIGDVSADAVFKFFREVHNQELIERLRILGLNFNSNIYIDTSVEVDRGLWDGMKVVLTGTLNNYTRNEAAKLIEDLGGKINSSVSKNVDFLVAGESAGSKYDKALGLNIRILTEEEFEEALADPANFKASLEQ